MYLHLLSDAQKTTLFSFAYRLSTADGEDSTEESRKMDELRQQLGLRERPDMEQVLGEITAGPFESAKVRSIAMMELLVLAYADGYLHEAEAALIGEIAEAFEIGQERLNAMAEWAMDYLDVMRGGDAFVGGQGQ